MGGSLLFLEHFGGREVVKLYYWEGDDSTILFLCTAKSWCPGTTLYDVSPSAHVTGSTAIGHRRKYVCQG